MSDEPALEWELSPNESVRVQLPHGLGHVDIISGQDDLRGHPQVEVHAVSVTTPETPAADGRHYYVEAGTLYPRLYITGYTPEETY